ncbi:4-galactosyl-N-acetylglucosaminide 3-alpha-L-fucosyltransferase 9-like [Antennarius striatus]|uniref:4-galactosyl-N-acetylglucosaminide 3-alpha-L-fucosyltransferase 9-like n=1 Tax=Antennarius striatus TaxID=241820 RepID=UPI0035B23CC7
MTIVLMWSWNYKNNLSLCKYAINIEGCLITSDKRLYNRSDGVIVQNRRLHQNISGLPQLPRPSFQKWVWMNKESPKHTRLIPGAEKLFNLTSTYRFDSDIPQPYGSIVAEESQGDLALPIKDKLVCWIVSNWHKYHERFIYYNEFRKHINIVVFGKKFGGHISREEYHRIIASCKFYLSFENSIFKDYISEKFYNALSLGTVPVVLGPPRDNYERIIQGDAFIHVNDFNSSKELADYLLLLDKNEAKYLKYFEWRRHFKVKSGPSILNTACRVCDHLRSHKEKETIDLVQWYWH